ncbi:acylphosphatase [Glycomyces xiaoerkulensis]|uniref:hypothetical protein n=1 Tax=Glycomyces xiaoerkulensis TaxID=2038139 RepID=UPI000C266161|nr:hypothetical protein [Glycomyces xiaoerkulensis]
MGATVTDTGTAAVSLEARLAGLIERESDRPDRDGPFATYQLNAFFAEACPGLELPWEWRWHYGCPRGRLTSMVRPGVTGWADACGDGSVEAEAVGGSEVMVQADCWAFGQRFTVWGYLDRSEADDIPNLAWGRSM